VKLKELNDFNEKLNEKLEYYKQFGLNDFLSSLRRFNYDSKDEFIELVNDACYVYQLVFGEGGYLFGDKEETSFYKRCDCQMMFNFLEKAFELLNRNDISRLVKTNANEFIDTEAIYWEEKFL
jgi:hypothetical protein